MKNYLATLLEEKGIDLDQDLDIEGQINLTPAVVIEFVDQLPAKTQENIQVTFEKIDFMNGNIMHFLKYLASGMAGQF